MVPIAASAGSGLVATLERVGVNTGFARAVAERMVDGALWADRLPAPRAFHALHPYGMSLVWGDSLAAAADDVADHLIRGDYRRSDEWLQVDPRWPQLDWDALLGAEPADRLVGGGEAGVVRFSRVNFSFDPARFRALHGASVVPDGWRVRRAAAPDFSLTGSVVPKFFWRDAAQFLAQGGGWCLERDGNPGAIAFTSFRFGREVEIGIETMPLARRQGLGLAVAVAMIKDLLADDLTPVWSCRRENQASYELALRLGFRLTRTIPYYRLPARR